MPAAILFLGIVDDFPGTRLVPRSSISLASRRKQDGDGYEGDDRGRSGGRPAGGSLRYIRVRRTGAAAWAWAAAWASRA
jgi:hypothetical protein